MAVALMLGSQLLGCGNDHDSYVVTGDLPATMPLASVVPIDGQLVVARDDGALYRVDRQGSSLAQLTSGFQDSEPHFHPQNSSLVFARRSPQGGAQSITTLSADGSSTTNRTPDLEVDAFSPDYSADGTRIAFAAGSADGERRIFRMNADGSDRRPLTEGHLDSDPAFSNDGRTLVFSRASGATSQIFKVSVNGGEAVPLTDPGHDDSDPSYIPGENVVLFTRDGQLVSMSDSHLATDPDGLTPFVLPGLLVEQALHAADGEGIFFLANSTLPSQNTEGGGDVWRVARDGSAPRKVTSQGRSRSLAVSTDRIREESANQVQVELVNDSGLPDSQVYVLLQTPQVANQKVSGPLTLLSNSGAAGVSGSGVAMSTLGQPSKTIVSPFTNQSRSVYLLAIQNLVSGQLNVSYGQPVAIVNGASPTSTTGYRYDKMELTYDESIRGGGGNLTSIDFYGIPIQVEVFHPGQSTPDPLQTKTFYASTPTLLKTLAGLSPAMASGTGWTRTLSGGTFDPTSSDFSTFARILSPNTIAAADTPQARPAPYPSFASYLASLQGKSFQLNGGQHGGYRYSATVVSDGNGGYNVECVGTTNQPPGPPAGGADQPAQLGSNLKVTLHFPLGQAGSASDPARSMDFFIYACVANSQSYSIEGYPFTGTTAQVNNKVGYANGTAYGSIVGDVQAALNFGYPDSNFVPVGGDLDSMFGSPVVLPYPYPFGGARSREGRADDGFYNPYAAILYYLSDSYGHPYSDRLDAASPLYSLQAGDTVRVTFLPDVRLDAPLGRASAITESGMTVSWPAVPGATGYAVDLLPRTIATTTVQGQTSTTLAGLTPGTTYLVSVTAKGGGGISSNSLPFQATTGGTRPALATGPANFQMNLGLPNNLSNLADLEVSIAGQPVGPTQNATFNLGYGTSLLELSIRSKSSGRVVYRNTYFLDVDAIGSSHFGFGLPFSLLYNLNGLTVVGAGKGPNDAQPSAGYSNTGNGLVIGTPFTPKPFYQYFRTVFP